MATDMVSNFTDLKTKDMITNHNDPPWIRSKRSMVIDKQSILNTINQIE